MVKSQLINRIADRQEVLARDPAQPGSHALSHRDIELSINNLLEHMSAELGQGARIEVRGFGSFSLHYRPPRRAHNPKTGVKVHTQAKHTPHFKPGKELRERVNATYLAALESGASTEIIDNDNDDDE